MDEETAQQLPEDVLLRHVRGDEKGRPFGSPRNPRLPSLEEFNPRYWEILADELAAVIVARKHGPLPDQTQRAAQMSNEELVRFCIEDPISATEVSGGLSLTGGHHRTLAIIRRVQFGLMAAATPIRILVHD